MTHSNPHPGDDAPIRRRSETGSPSGKETASVPDQASAPVRQAPVASGVAAGATRGKQLTVAEFRRLWMDTSISVVEIGRRLGISDRAVHDRAKARGLPKRPRKQPFKMLHDHGKLVALYRSGLSLNAVAMVAKCSRNTVQRAVRDAGVEVRPRQKSVEQDKIAAFLLGMKAAEEQAALRMAEMTDGFQPNRWPKGRAA